MWNSLQYNFETIIWPARYRFFGVFFTVLAVTYSFLLIIDFVPEPPADEVVAHHDTDTLRRENNEEDDLVLADDVVGDMVTSTTITTPTPSASPNHTQPIRMVIDALDRDITVLNPTSRRVADLDEALRHGAVRHPDAADFAREGNIFILGHSSRLPNVINRNYQIFNGIEDLEWGDIIRVYSEDTEYIYRVDRVYEARASEVTIEIAGTGPRLTLATCDSFGSIDDRFIVEAELQSSRPL